MEQLRFNFFHQIHQALRALMYHASITVQHTDFTNEDQANKTISLLKEMLAFFEGHAHTEDSLVFPMLDAYAPEVVADFEAQHVLDHQLGESLALGIEFVSAAASDAEKIVAGRYLQRVLAEFTAFNLSHMNKEESTVLEILHRHYTDEQLHEKEREIVESLSDEKKALSGYWMLKGLSLPEIVNWYRAIQATAPSFVFDRFMDLAEKALPAEKLKSLQQNLQLSLA